MHSPSESLARRQLERQIIEDGTAIWKTKKDIEAQLALQERKQVSKKKKKIAKKEKPATLKISKH